MIETQLAHPPVTSRVEWLAARKELLLAEKAHTREYDRINAVRRRLPMVKVEKPYVFQGADGVKPFADLFEGRTQLIVHHFMFHPDWERGCMGCTSFVNALGDLSALAEKDTTLVLVSRAPYEKLAAYREKHGWTLPWYSAGDGDFNYDFGVTIDPRRGPVTYNYKTQEELEKEWGPITKPFDASGQSVFFRLGDEVFHTYSTFARGGEALTDTSHLLDITPYGRQEDFEDSPAGWPQKPTYG